jgi:hypothetical protein
MRSVTSLGTIGGRHYVGAAIEKRLMPRMALRGRRGFLVTDDCQSPQFDEGIKNIVICREPKSLHW